MKKFRTLLPHAIFLVFFVFPMTPSLAASEHDQKAKEVASAWFVSLMKGETELAISLSAVPFNFGNELEVHSTTELKNVYDGVVAKKGIREIKPTSAKIESTSNSRIEVVLFIGDEKVYVTIQPGDNFLVVGFTE